MLKFGFSLCQGVGLGSVVVSLLLPPQFLLAETAPPSSAAAGFVAQAATGKAAALPPATQAPVKIVPVLESKLPKLAARKPDEQGLYRAPVSLSALNLERAPSEKELRLAGQLGSPLTPVGSADAKAIADPAKHKKQEADNLAFGKAMQKWNQHDYQGAVALFREHRNQFSDSPWAGEVELHLGCEAQFTGNWNEAKLHFDYELASEPKGSDIYQKVKLRRAVLHMDQGEMAEAVRTFQELLATETSWERRTYAQRWLLDLNRYQANAVALRTCGSNSVAYVLRQKGQRAKAESVSLANAPSEAGFHLGELLDLAVQNGLKPVAVKADGLKDFKKLPLPFIAHYRDKHFVVVDGFTDHGLVSLYDSRLQQSTKLTASAFEGMASGVAVIFGDKPEGIADASAYDLKLEYGGCCGIPRYPGKLGDDNDDDCNKKNQGMPGWSVNPVNMNVCVQDVPMWYDSPVGPRVQIALSYNSQDSLNQLRPVGNKWVLNYASYLMESPGHETPGSVLIVMPNGRGDIYHPNSDSTGYVAPAGITNVLTKTGTYAYQLQLNDGTIYRYGVPPEMSTTSFSSLLLSITDRFGTSLSISHRADGTINQITNFANQHWTFTYYMQGASAGMVQQVADDFGRTAQFGYDASGNLTSQTDMGGVSYGYSYDPNVYITAVHKPSGDTNFLIEPADGVSNNSNAYPDYGSPMWENYRVTITDPNGFAEEYYYNGYSHYGWYRDRRQFQSPLPALDAPKTRFEYLQPNTGGNGVVYRTTFADGSVSTSSNYNGDLRPAILTDENGWTTQTTYNAQGKPLTKKDAKSQTTTYEYAANGFDLTKVTDPSGNVLNRYEYDGGRNIIKQTNGNGGIALATYNALGQPTSLTTPNGIVVNITYDASNRPSSWKVGQNVIRTMSYDAVSRTVSDTNVNGYTKIYEYDNLNRVTRVLHPDGTDERTEWDCCNVSKTTDRLGRATLYAHDSRGNLVITRNPNNSVLQYYYDPFGNLSAIYDGNRNVTAFEYDVRNRLSRKILADASQYQYTYDYVGNMVGRTSPNGVAIAYTYDPNRNLTGVSAPGLTAINYTYDVHNWLKQVTDGVGTTLYTYDTGGRITRVDGPLDSDVVTYGFNAGNQITSKTVNGVTTTYTYNTALGRCDTVNGPIGQFTFNYRNAVASDLTSITYPNAQVTGMQYNDPQGNGRLSQITNSGTSSQGLLSQFGYQYNAKGNVTNWSQQLGGSAAANYQFSYDAMDQLIAVAGTGNLPAGISAAAEYAYDNAGNRTVVKNGNALDRSQYNALNQRINRDGSGSGKIPFAGLVNEPASVTVNSAAVPVQSSGSFATSVDVAPGNTVVSATAVDPSGNQTSKQYQITVAAGSENQALTYDPNGNLKSCSAPSGLTTYEWDPLDRLIAVNKGTVRTEFRYTGQGHRSEIIEKSNGTVTSDKHLTWAGSELVEQREVVAGVTKKYGDMGFKVTGGSAAGNYYTTRDHLGSIRELTDSSGALRARYSYDVWGMRTKLSGDLDTDMGYTGLYYQASADLNLAFFRQYDASAGRWLSKDPIGTELTVRYGAPGVHGYSNAQAEVLLNDPNLYLYVRNNPVNLTDPSGLKWWMPSGVSTGIASNFLDGICGGITSCRGSCEACCILSAAGLYIAANAAMIAATVACGEATILAPMCFAEAMATYFLAIADITLNLNTCTSGCKSKPCCKH